MTGVPRRRPPREIAGKRSRECRNRNGCSFGINALTPNFAGHGTGNDGVMAAVFACYTESMLDEVTFRRNADAALESLKKSLIAAEESGEFEVEENSGALNILFDEPPGKFVITPNAPVRQIWISALSTSFKLDWSEEQEEFVLPRDNTSIMPLVSRLINQHLGTETVSLV
jgi:iron donor protein CyaY